MLAKAAAGRPLRFVHVSSLAAVGPALDGKPVSEDSVPHPISHYGRSKLEGERLVRRFLPDAVVVRPPVVYGPRDRGVFQLLKPIARGIAVEIAGGDRWFSSIFVRDLVEGLMAAARAKQAAGRTYFLAHPKAATWNDLQTAAARIVGRRLRVIRVPIAVAHLAGRCSEAWSRASRKPGIISRDKVADAVCRYWTCDPSRAASELGFTARMPLEDGLAETLAWYKEAGWLRY
jgi:nucleoside-diphosphate-sugar epimerase